MNINEKLKKVNGRFNVEMYDNGFMLEISGRTDDDDYGNARIMCQTVDELLELVREAATMERDD
jgi:hypothetical protein